MDPKSSGLYESFRGTGAGCESSGGHLLGILDQYWGETPCIGSKLPMSLAVQESKTFENSQVLIIAYYKYELSLLYNY